MTVGLPSAPIMVMDCARAEPSVIAVTESGQAVASVPGIPAVKSTTVGLPSLPMIVTQVTTPESSASDPAGPGTPALVAVGGDKVTPTDTGFGNV